MKQNNSLDAEHFYKLGNSKSDSKDYEGAIENFKKVIEIDSSFPNIFYFRGEANRELGNYESAIKDFTKALAFKPSAGVFYFRGFCHVELGNYESAIKDYTKSLEIDSEEHFVYLARGNAKNFSEDYSGAIEDLDIAIKLNSKPESDDDYSSLIDTYDARSLAKYKLQNYSGAIKDLTNAIEMDPEEPYFYYQRGINMQLNGNDSEAIRDFNKVLDIDPNYRNADYIRGISKYNLKDYKGACKDWKNSADRGYKPAEKYLNKYC